MASLSEKLLAVHRSLDDKNVPHAFGGAIALAYCIAEPRATIDLDVNVFSPSAQAATVLGALPREMTVTAKQVDAAISNAQVRVRWDETYVDLFFSNHEFHKHAAARIRIVPFEDERIPILDCSDLVVLKAIFNRPKHWLDIELADDIGAIDHAIAATWVAELLGTESPAFQHLAAIFEGKRGDDAASATHPFLRRDRDSDARND